MYGPIYQKWVFKGRQARPTTSQKSDSLILMVERMKKSKCVVINCFLGYPRMTGKSSFFLLDILEPTFWILQMLVKPTWIHWIFREHLNCISQKQNRSWTSQFRTLKCHLVPIFLVDWFMTQSEVNCPFAYCFCLPSCCAKNPWQTGAWLE